jgi:DNA polymerase I-like protein with 3'-5' exonuclease and polymerase domains
MTLRQGPKKLVAAAQAIVKDMMERPLPRPLLVDLTVDIKNADTWYEAK